MNTSTAIRLLWQGGYFLEHRKPKEVEDKIFEDYQLTCSNISQYLSTSKKFLRKEAKGWIQKMNYSDYDSKTVSKRELIEELLDNRDLWYACKPSFESKKYWDSCLLALRHLETKIREKSGLNAEDHGVNLVVKAFNLSNGILRIPSCAVASEEEGFLAINRGMVLFHRNAHGHRDGRISKNNAIKIICYIDYLLEILKTAIIRI